MWLKCKPFPVCLHIWYKGFFKTPLVSCQSLRSHSGPTHLRVSANGATAGGRGDVVSEVGRQQHRVAWRESAGLTVAHACVHHVSPATRPLAVTANGHIEGCCVEREREHVKHVFCSTHSQKQAKHTRHVVEGKRITGGTHRCFALTCFKKKNGPRLDYT